jgi:transposase
VASHPLFRAVTVQNTPRSLRLRPFWKKLNQVNGCAGKNSTRGGDFQLILRGLFCCKKTQRKRGKAALDRSTIESDGRGLMRSQEGKRSQAPMSWVPWSIPPTSWIAMGPGLPKPSTPVSLVAPSLWTAPITAPICTRLWPNLATGQSKSSHAPTGILPRRWVVVERTLAWLNRNRRLAKDFETSITSATTWIYIAATQLLIRRLTSA